VDVAGETKDTVCPERSYYVTDGGATENLGLLSALYALRAALKQLPAQEIPEIHIVTIEASATAYDYHTGPWIGRGKGRRQRAIDGRAHSGAVERGTGIGAAVRPSGDDRRIHVHDLALPLAFRSRGGFGTHWMFPRLTSLVENPRAATPLIGYERLLAEWFANDPPSAVIDKDAAHRALDGVART